MVTPRPPSRRKLGRDTPGNSHPGTLATGARISHLTRNMADKKSKHRKNKQQRKANTNQTDSIPPVRTRKEKKNKALGPNKETPLQVTFTRMTRSKGNAGDGTQSPSKVPEAGKSQRTDAFSHKSSGKNTGESSLVPLFSKGQGQAEDLPSPKGSPSHDDVSKQASPTSEGSTYGGGETHDAIDSQVNTRKYVDPDKISKQQEHYKDMGPDILQTLSSMNAKLQKLDALDSLTITLKEGHSSVQEKVEGVLVQVGTVKNDLRRCEAKWEEGINALSERVSQLEQGAQGMDSKWDNKWDSYRTKLQKDAAITQSGIDSNSSKILELEAKVAQYQEKWETLEGLEKKIKDAAEKKFKVVQKAIKEEIQEEMSENIRVTVKQQIKEEKSSTTHRPPPEDAQPSQYDRMRDQAHRKRHNIILFGMADNESQDSDMKDVLTFFSERMNLTDLDIENTYRLGSYSNSKADRPRPLVVTFSNIRHRWAVWNRRGKIKFVQDIPIWLHEDLPKQLRNDNRVLQRIAKVARMNPELYGEVRVKDYKLNMNGQNYSTDDLHLLPKELSPQAVYSPRSDSALVFFTRNSPFSNHFPSNFSLEGLSFSCVEQYLAVQRAYLSQDKPLARRAMEQQDPAEHKVILNKLRNDHLEEWRRKVPELIRDALRAKFTQNTLLKDLLLSTHSLRLGEASKDTFWGVGLTLENQSVLDTDRWAPEGNLLGRTLMALREELS